MASHSISARVPRVTLFESEAELPKRRSAMKTFITALALVFALATFTSVVVLHHANVDQGRHTAGHQKMALLY
jgi:hypothetical protein